MEALVALGSKRTGCTRPVSRKEDFPSSGHSGTWAAIAPVSPRTPLLVLCGNEIELGVRKRPRETTCHQVIPHFLGVRLCLEMSFFDIIPHIRSVCLPRMKKPLPIVALDSVQNSSVLQVGNIRTKKMTMMGLILPCDEILYSCQVLRLL